jgi:hypothetical protein
MLTGPGAPAALKGTSEEVYAALLDDPYRFGVVK